MAYAKLFSTIVTSTVWGEPHTTRIVWITMLATADKNGEVMATIPGIARLANVTIAEAEEAIARFLAPDPYSRTPDDEGRRIEKIEGGWHLLNYEKYRRMASLDEKKESNAERQRRHRERKKRNGVPVTSNALDGQNNATVTPKTDKAEAEAEAEANKSTTPFIPLLGEVVGDSQAPASVPVKGKLQLRAEALFRRRPTTPLDDAEKRAFRKNREVIEQTSEEDWKALEAFYSAPQSVTYARKDLATLLNNWNSEIDRAKAYLAKGGQSAGAPVRGLKFV